MGLIETIASGTQLAVISTEHVLAEVGPESAGVGTALLPGLYVCLADAVNQQAGDSSLFNTYQKMLSGGAWGWLERKQNTGLLTSTTAWMSSQTPVDVALKFTLLQSAGIGRNFPWKVVRINPVAGVLDELVSGHQTSGSVGKWLHLIKAATSNKVEYDDANARIRIYDDDGSTVLVTLAIESLATGGTRLRPL